jgi:hypothetical protein
MGRRSRAALDPPSAANGVAIYGFGLRSCAWELLVRTRTFLSDALDASDSVSFIDDFAGLYLFRWFLSALALRQQVHIHKPVYDRVEHVPDRVPLQQRFWIAELPANVTFRPDHE